MNHRDFFTSEETLNDYREFCMEFNLCWESVHSLDTYYKNKFKDGDGEL